MQTTFGTNRATHKEELTFHCACGRKMQTADQESDWQHACKIEGRRSKNKNEGKRANAQSRKSPERTFSESRVASSGSQRKVGAELGKLGVAT